MPQTPISCGFKVLKRITTPLCFGWIKKKKRSVHLCSSACWYAFISVMPGVWIWTAPHVILKKVFSVARCLVTAAELPAKHSLSAHCAESSQTRPFSYYFLSVADTHSKGNVYQKKKRWVTVGEEENRTGGEREARREGWRREWGVTGAREGSWCPSGEK